jgi:hypothetical protein
MMTAIEARREIFHSLTECREGKEPLVSWETAEQLSWPLFYKLKAKGLLNVEKVDEDC